VNISALFHAIKGSAMIRASMIYIDVHVTGELEFIRHRHPIKKWPDIYLHRFDRFWLKKLRDILHFLRTLQINNLILVL
jgi:hypothetical protein